ncbi:MAG TPA: DUF2203 family protein [Abditibacteriaceae bacterium]|nr:DUF2203 family protein [Abditibacteriaceae bacterium]
MEEFRQFTLQEANAALPEVIGITEEYIERLAAVQEPWSRLALKKFDALRGVAEEDLIRVEWAQRMAWMGVQPKGFFVADFQSPDPDTLYCWTYGEDVVSHEHKTWETFVHRRRIKSVDQFEGHSPQGHSAPPHDASP